MAEARGKLTVTVRNAVQLPVVKHHTHILSKLAPRMNPYVVLILGNEVRQTKPHQGGHRDPVWNDQVVFDLMPGLGDLELKVMHKGSLTGKDTEIASGTVSSHILKGLYGQEYRVSLVGPGMNPGQSTCLISAVFELDTSRVGQQFDRYRSSSVESNTGRAALRDGRSSSNSSHLTGAKSQTMANETPAWMGSAMRPSFEGNGQNGMTTQLSSSTPTHKSSRWRFKNLISHGKKDPQPDDKASHQTGDSSPELLSNQSSAREEYGYIHSRPVPEEVLQSVAELSFSHAGNPEQAQQPQEAFANNGTAIQQREQMIPSRQTLSSPERRVQNQAPARKESGFKMMPAEEYPLRGQKTRWLEGWERDQDRRATESSLPDPRLSQFPSAMPMSNRRMTDTGEMAPPMANNVRDDPNWGRIKGGRQEINTFHEYSGPVPSGYKISDYMPQAGGKGQNDLSWNVKTRHNGRQTLLTDESTQWQGMANSEPQRLQQSSFPNAPPMPAMPAQPLQAESRLQGARARPQLEEPLQAMPGRQPSPSHSSQADVPSQRQTVSSQQSAAHSLRQPSNESQYPQPEYSLPGESLSDKFGGFMSNDRPVFDTLLDRQATGNVPFVNPHSSIFGDGLASQRAEGNVPEPESLLPYRSPFAQDGPETQPNGGQSSTSDRDMLNSDNSGSQMLSSKPPQSQATTKPRMPNSISQKQSLTRPLREVKAQIEGSDSEDSEDRAVDLDKAMTSLHRSDIADDDSYLIDEDDLTIEVDAKGKARRLGKGAFGEVFKGEYNYAPVAIKVLKVNSARALKDALSEMKVLQKIHHSHIVRLMGYTITEQVDPTTQARTVKKVKLVTELLDSSLWTALRRGSCTWFKGGDVIAWEVTTGLYQMHKKNIWHLDLKSANILLTDNGHAKIADFGMAAVVGMNMSTIKGQGTYAWAAPELMLYNKPTAKSDVFSLGVVLWEICTGEPPERGNLYRVTPDLAPPEIADLITRCIDDEEKRPTVAQILDILRPPAKPQ